MSHVRYPTCRGSSTSSRARRASLNLRAAPAAERNLAREKVKSNRARRWQCLRMENYGRRRLSRRRLQEVTIWWRFTRFRSCRISTSSSLSLTSLHPYYVRLFSYPSVCLLSLLYSIFYLNRLLLFPFADLRRVESKDGETRQAGDYFEMQVESLLC